MLTIQISCRVENAVSTNQAARLYILVVGAIGQGHGVGRIRIDIGRGGVGNESK